MNKSDADLQRLISVIYKFLKMYKKDKNEQLDEILTEIDDIKKEIQEFNEATNQKLFEILSTAIGMSKSSEDTLELVHKRINEMQGVKNLNEKSSDPLWTVGQDLLNTRLTDIISEDLGITNKKAKKILEGWIIDEYGSGLSVTQMIDRGERESVGQKLIEYLETKHNISYKAKLFIEVYFDAYYLFFTTENRDKIDGLFDDIKNEIRKSKKRRAEELKNPPQPGNNDGMKHGTNKYWEFDDN